VLVQTTYTGTWAHGGGPPTNYDGPKDLATQLSRGIRADQRRVNVEAAAAAVASESLVRPEMAAMSPHIMSTPRQKANSQNGADPLRAKFIAFAVFGKGAAVMAEAERRPSAVVMDSKGFAKLCKESDIMGSRLDLTRVDLCFTKACDKVRCVPPRRW
jgi:p25-alpha